MILSAKDDSTIRPHTDFVNQHYIPQMIIRNFSNVNPSGKTYNTFYVDLNDPEQKIQKRNTERIFCEDNMYDMEGDDPVILEKAFNEYIEAPMKDLLETLGKDPYHIDINRKQLKFLKKYVLMQMYRTARNRCSYTKKPSELEMEFCPEISDEASGLRFWKETMYEILTSEWDELEHSENREIRTNCSRIMSTFMMFVGTNDQFVLTDAATACEMNRIDLEFDDTMQKALEITSEEYGVPSETLEKAIRNRGEHFFTNYQIFPLKSNLALLVVNPIWKYLQIKEPSFEFTRYVGEASLLWDLIVFPENRYVNGERISLLQRTCSSQEELNEKVSELYTDDDRFVYEIRYLDCDSTAIINGLLINECRSMAFKTPGMISYSVRVYNSGYLPNKKHDLTLLKNNLKRLSNRFVQ